MLAALLMLAAFIAAGVWLASGIDGYRHHLARSTRPRCPIRWPRPWSRSAGAWLAQLQQASAAVAGAGRWPIVGRAAGAVLLAVAPSR